MDFSFWIYYTKFTPVKTNQEDTKMSIGNKIRLLRGERHISQETLAESMGVSFQAVSKWETGVAAPDISLLPAIAAFFGVSTDELLDYDQFANKKKITEICDHAASLRDDHPEEAEKILREGLKKFPGNEILLNNLLYTLPAERSDEAVVLCKALIETARNDEVKYDALRILAEIYHANGQKSLCAETLEKIPEIYFTKLQLAAYLLDGDASINAAQKQLHLDFESMIRMTSVFKNRLIEKKKPEEAKAWCELIIGILNVILDERNGKFLSDSFLSLCRSSLKEFEM